MPLYATPADPSALLAAAVSASEGGGELPVVKMPTYRFTVMLEGARNMVSQLIQFGNSMLSLSEKQDAEALSELLQTQGSELMLQSIRLQDNTLMELDMDKVALEATRKGVQLRLDSYQRLCDEDISDTERRSMDLMQGSSVLAATAGVLRIAGAVANMAPNTFGMAVGGSDWGGLPNAYASGIDIMAGVMQADAQKLAQSEQYRRRLQEWTIQRDTAEADLRQTDAQLATLEVRRTAAELQKEYLKTQQTQTQTQLAFLQNKFTSQALYNWLRGRLAAVYYQFYDLAVSRCRMAEMSWQYELNDPSSYFIRPGSWQGSYAGQLAGESLMLSLAQMEKSYLENDEREKEVVRTVSLAEVYSGLSENVAFNLSEQIAAMVNGDHTGIGGTDNNLKWVDGQVQATVGLAGLGIAGDYPANMGSSRRIKNISVTLPALLGPYQDVRAVLSYGGDYQVPRGCNAIALSHGMDDSGQFRLDVSDPRWLPFEGIPVDGKGGLTLSFPDAGDKQKTLLLSLSDIILHIRYTIRS